MLGDSGIHSGDLLVATTEAGPGRRPAPTRRPLLTRSSAPPGPVPSLWFAVAAGVAALAGWFAARAGTSDLATVAVGLLAARGARRRAPGRAGYARYRALAAPAFGAAAAFAVVWDPHLERLPMVVGITALAGGGHGRRRLARWATTSRRACGSG